MAAIASDILQDGAAATKSVQPTTNARHTPRMLEPDRQCYIRLCDKGGILSDAFLKCELQEFLSLYGTVEAVSRPRPMPKSKNMRSCFVQFAEASELEACLPNYSPRTIELSGMHLRIEPLRQQLSRKVPLLQKGSPSANAAPSRAKKKQAARQRHLDKRRMLLVEVGGLPGDTHESSESFAKMHVRGYLEDNFGEVLVMKRTSELERQCVVRFVLTEAAKACLSCTSRHVVCGTSLKVHIMSSPSLVTGADYYVLPGPGLVFIGGLLGGNREAVDKFATTHVRRYLEAKFGPVLEMYARVSLRSAGRSCFVRFASPEAAKACLSGICRLEGHFVCGTSLKIAESRSTDGVFRLLLRPAGEP